MKHIMENKVTQVGVKVALVAALTVLSGCLVTVGHFSGGKVSSDLGDDCLFGCAYQLNEGESLNETLTATPLPGNDFVRWSDSLGEDFAICPQPTQLACNLVIDDLHPLFEGQTLDVVAQFRVVNGYNANVVSFEDTATTSRGTFQQVDDVTWIESYPNAIPTNYYNTEVRSELRLVIYDRFADVRYFIDFSTGIIQQQLGMAATTPWGTVLGRSAAPTGWLATQVKSGDSVGFYKGDYIQTEPETWIFRKKGRKNAKYTFAEIDRDGAGVTLRDDSRNVDVVLNLADGNIYSSQLSGPLEPVGIVQGAAVFINGFTASELAYGENSADVSGYFVEQGSNRWLQLAADGESLLAEFDLVRRSSTVIELIEVEDTFKVNINISTLEIDLLSVPVPLPIESFEIISAK
ncbi:MAG: hypothetical protein AB8B81_14170 [Halioglobus sp.]